MEITPEIQVQLEAQKKNCVFCKVISGEMQGKIVYNDSLLSAVLDINPAVKGHMLLMPKEHYPIMPYLPPNTFKHLFSILPKMVGTLKNAMLSTGANIFIANGGAAGQQSPHFLIHLIPRENNDKFNKFSLEGKSVDENKEKQVISMISNNLPLMMERHFNRNPAKWHTGKGETTSFAERLGKQILYEDEKFICIAPTNPVCLGHVVIYCKKAYDFEDLNKEESFHLFSLASLASTAVFEGLRAQGSNIIIKTGTSDDNSGRTSAHIIPRFQDDGLDLLWSPMNPKPDLDDVASKIKSEMLLVEHEANDQDDVMTINMDSDTRTIFAKKKKKATRETDEITKAIEKLKRS